MSNRLKQLHDGNWINPKEIDSVTAYPEDKSKIPGSEGNFNIFPRVLIRCGNYHYTIYSEQEGVEGFELAKTRRDEIAGWANAD